MILKKAKEEIETDKKKREALVQKTLVAKEERDRLLREAKSQKQNIFIAQRQQELKEVNAL